MTERDPLLVEREKTHGSFKDNAKVFSDLCDAVPGQFQQSLPEHHLAITMIMMKLSRILTGQFDFKDHWDDIAGYAKLGSEACE